MPKDNRLRRPREFQLVYKQGARFHGDFVTIFLMPNGCQAQRLGITASRKGVGNAVARNRAKRLLREAFRLCAAELSELQTNYDWVFNARRKLLEVKLESPMRDLRRIISEVRKKELLSETGETK